MLAELGLETGTMPACSQYNWGPETGGGDGAGVPAAEMDGCVPNHRALCGAYLMVYALGGLALVIFAPAGLNSTKESIFFELLMYAGTSRISMEISMN